MARVIHAMVFDANILIAFIVNEMLRGTRVYFVFILTVVLVGPKSDQAGNSHHGSYFVPFFPVPGIVVGDNVVILTVQMHDGDITVLVT